MNDTARNTSVYDALRPELAKLIPPPGKFEDQANLKWLGANMALFSDMQDAMANANLVPALLLQPCAGGHWRATLDSYKREDVERAKAEGSDAIEANETFEASGEDPFAAITNLCIEIGRRQTIVVEDLLRANPLFALLLAAAAKRA